MSKQTSSSSTSKSQSLAIAENCLPSYGEITHLGILYLDAVIKEISRLYTLLSRKICNAIETIELINQHATFNYYNYINVFLLLILYR